ncbi:MAG: DUF296 domain-containing protein [Polyangiaceae bacterium]|nr:DUF296 domain-containing protein [Polyangiaceae bacterium]
MRLVDADAISRGIIRTDPGEDLLAALATLARAAGWEEALVSGAGVLELCELAVAPGEATTLENAAVTCLAGRITRHEGGVEVALHATVLAAGEAKSGRIVAAVTGPLSLVVDAIAGRPAVTARARPAPQPSPPAAPRPAPAESPAAPPVALGFGPIPVPKRPPAPVPEDDEEGGVEFVNAGDFLDHPQFGLCAVLGEDPSGGTRVRSPAGRLLVLRLEALRVLPAATDAEGHQIYKVVGPRR